MQYHIYSCFSFVVNKWNCALKGFEYCWENYLRQCSHLDEKTDNDDVTRAITCSKCVQGTEESAKGYKCTGKSEVA